MYESPPPIKTKKYDLSRRGFWIGYICTWFACILYTMGFRFYLHFIYAEGTILDAVMIGLAQGGMLGIMASLWGGFNASVLGKLLHHNQYSRREYIFVSLIISSPLSAFCVGYAPMITADSRPGDPEPSNVFLFGSAYGWYILAMLGTSWFLYTQRQKISPYTPPKRSLVKKYIKQSLSDTRHISEPPLLKSSSSEPRPPKSTLPKIEKKLGPAIPPPKKKE